MYIPLWLLIPLLPFTAFGMLAFILLVGFLSYWSKDLRRFEMHEMGDKLKRISIQWFLMLAISAALFSILFFINSKTAS